MHYKAVIFDLFGTLISKFPIGESIDVLIDMAGVLGVDAKEFTRLWFESFDDRHGGRFADQHEDIEYVTGIMGVRPPDEAIHQAAQINLDYVGSHIAPYPGTLETLGWLREHGYKVCLLSNWSDEIPSVWDGTVLAPFFDVVIFSCQAGMMKPDPRIYRMAINRLEVEPETCLFIGDGDSSELDGAKEAGMEPVLLRFNGKEPTDDYPVNTELENWDGPTIHSLTEIPGLLEPGD